MLIDATAPKNKPETAQMVVIHKALRREFSLLPRLVGTVQVTDSARARLLTGHAELLLLFLHTHHDGEDRLLWPLLADRVPSAKKLTETMEQQHRTMDALIGTIRPELTDWSAGDSTARERLAVHLTQLDAALAGHLDAEEAEVLPLVHEYVTVAEWEAMEKDASKHMPRNPRVGLVMAGMVLEDATPAERAWFMNELPAAARLMWRLAGQSRYAAYRRRIRAA
jgi:hemerythrin-like domain-containing protein